MNLLVVLTTLALIYSVADALTCKHCDPLYMEGSSDSALLQHILAKLNGPPLSGGPGNCMDDAQGADDMACPPVPDVMCAKLDLTGTLTEAIGSERVSANVRVVQRSCFPAGDFTVGCHPPSAFEEHLFSGDEGFTLSDFGGEFCLCDTDNCNADN